VIFTNKGSPARAKKASRRNGRKELSRPTFICRGKWGCWWK
jgi:hypothetical protein